MTAPPRAHVAVRVVPRASRTALARDPRGGLRAHLNAPPVEGAANRALLALLAATLDLPKSTLAVVRGERSRDKVVAVQGISAAELARRLAVAGLDVDKPADRG